MAILHLPLTINQTGFFERASTEEDSIGSRLKLFITSGAGEYLRLPSPGIRALWIQMYTMGVSSRFAVVMEEFRLRELENIIRGEVNSWFEDVYHVEEVKLVGDEHEENGIKFSVANREFTFHFHYILPGKGTHIGTVGPWRIVESVHEIN